MGLEPIDGLTRGTQGLRRDEPTEGMTSPIVRPSGVKDEVTFALEGQPIEEHGNAVLVLHAADVRAENRRCLAAEHFSNGAARAEVDRGRREES